MAKEPYSLRLSDFTPLTGAVEYTTRTGRALAYDIVSGNSLSVVRWRDLKSDVKIAALSMYNATIITALGASAVLASEVAGQAAGYLF